MSVPTKKEIKELEPVFHHALAFGKKQPNVCMSFYKNRGGRYNRIKVWLYVDYSTMRVHDLYCTNYDNEIIADIPQTYMKIEEDKVVATTSKDDIIMILDASDVELSDEEVIEVSCEDVIEDNKEVSDEAPAKFSMIEEETTQEQEEVEYQEAREEMLANNSEDTGINALELMETTEEDTSEKLEYIDFVIELNEEIITGDN